MYWRFKLPLIIILLAVLSFLCYKVVVVFKERQNEAQEKAQTTTPNTAVSIPEIPAAIPKEQLNTLEQPGTFTVAEIPDNANASKPNNGKPTSAAATPIPPAPLPAPGITPPVIAVAPSPAAATVTPAIATTPTPPAAASTAAKTNPPQASQAPRPLPTPKTVPTSTSTATASTPAASSHTVATTPAASAPATASTAAASSHTVATTPATASTAVPSNTGVQPAPSYAQTLAKAAALATTSPVTARDMAWNILAQSDVAEYSKCWYQAAQIVNSINKTVTTSSVAFPEKQTYVVEPGNVLVRIAFRQKTTVQLLMGMNKIRDPRKIWPRQKLAYITGPWTIRVSKSQFLLSLYRDGKLYRIYKVGIGKDNRTPTGTFQIRDKVINPHWDSPEGRIPPSDPRNILGTRWMGLDATGSTSPYLTGYGIHGTTLPETVGTPSSAGCVRLKNEDIEELFNYIPEPASDKVQVTITE